MFDVLGAGPGAIVGTLAGIAVVGFLHWLFPQVADAIFLDASIVALGFIGGIWVDTRCSGD